MSAEPLRGRALRNGMALVFGGSALLFFVVVSRFRAFYDTDSYYRLAVARAYAQGGMLHAFPWARFSLLTEGFGDKELAFHLLLAPFVVLFKAKSSGAGSASFSRVLAVSTCTAGKRNDCYLVERRRETPAR